MMSHRRLPVRDRGSGVCAFGAAGTLRKFMSAILTHLGFNVTKDPAATKHKVASRCRLPKREPIAPDERHFGKHTGLPSFAKACPADWCQPRAAGAGTAANSSAATRALDQRH